MHLYVHAQMQVQLQPCWRINIRWLPGEWNSKYLTGSEFLLPICEQILISCNGNGVSQIISVLKSVCFLDATACYSKNNLSTWCFITLPLIFPQKEQAGKLPKKSSYYLTGRLIGPVTVGKGTKRTDSTGKNKIIRLVWRLSTGGKEAK